MFEELKSKLTNIKDFNRVLEVLMGAREPMVVVLLFGDQQSGEIWIRGGVKIVGARTRSGDSGYGALMDLLALKNPTFEVMRAGDEPPGAGIDIDVVDVVSNRQKVIDAIKLRVWRLSATGQAAKAMNMGQKPPASQLLLDRSGSDNTSEASGAAMPEPKLPNKQYSSYRLSDKDDLAAARKAALEAAKATAPAEQITDNLAQQHAALLAPKVDDLHQRRVGDLEAAARGEIVFPKLPAEQLDVPPSLSQTERARHSTDPSAKTFQEEVDDFFVKREIYTQPGAPSATGSMQTLAYLRKNKKDQSFVDHLKNGWNRAVAVMRFEEFDVGETAKRIFILKQIPKGAYVAGCLSLLALPIAGFLGYQRASLDKQIDAEDRLSLGAEVNSTMDEPYIGIQQPKQHFDIAAAEREIAENAAQRASELSAVDKVFSQVAAVRLTPVTFKLPDLHNPFRPPAARPDTGNTPAPSGISKGTQEDLEKAFEWHMPEHLPPKLSVDQIMEITRQIKTGEELVALGRTREALSLYTALLARYPQHRDLRLVAIRCCMLSKDYQTAKVWCIEGMEKATAYPDFLIFKNMLKTMPGADKK